MPARKNKHTPHGFGAFAREHRVFALGVVATLALTVATYYLHTYVRDFMANMLDIRQPAPFDGTSLPVAQVPDWTALSSAENQLAASAINPERFVPLPEYDPKIFGVQIASLDWRADQSLINALITYSVPYMGQYTSGSREFSGSHLGVDIRLPEGTEILAVANGEVTKVAQSTTGFGKHVVIEHPNVPLLSTNETTTLHSGYAHLSQISVKKGDIVTRGQVIGLSGDTGTSTTPLMNEMVVCASS